MDGEAAGGGGRSRGAAGVAPWVVPGGRRFQARNDPFGQGHRGAGPTRQLQRGQRQLARVPAEPSAAQRGCGSTGRSRKGEQTKTEPIYGLDRALLQGFVEAKVRPDWVALSL